MLPLIFTFIYFSLLHAVYCKIPTVPLCIRKCSPKDHRHLSQPLPTGTVPTPPSTKQWGTSSPSRPPRPRTFRRSTSSPTSTNPSRMTSTSSSRWRWTRSLSCRSGISSTRCVGGEERTNGWTDEALGTFGWTDEARGTFGLLIYREPKCY